MNPLASRPVRCVAAVLAALVFAAGFFLGAGPASAAHHAVTISSYSYHPAALTISAGDTVTWTNLDSVGHDVTITRGPVLFHSPLLSQGQSFSYTFTVAGPYTYICSVHPDMTATLTVDPAPVRQPVAAAPTRAATKAGAVATARTPAASPKAAVSPAVPSASPTLAAATGSPSTQINPLLLVAGALCAVVIFCLLVMASRPQTVAVVANDPDDPDDLDAAPTRVLPPAPPVLVGHDEQ